MHSYGRLWNGIPLKLEVSGFISVLIARKRKVLIVSFLGSVSFVSANADCNSSSDIKIFVRHMVLTLCAQLYYWDMPNLGSY